MWSPPVFRGGARISLALLFCVLVSIPATKAWSQQTFPTGPVGKITACFGDAVIEGTDPKQPPRKADLHVQINNHERIVTNGGSVSVLLDSRVVLRIDGNSALRVDEGVGQTNLEL